MVLKVAVTMEDIVVLEDMVTVGEAEVIVALGAMDTVEEAIVVEGDMAIVGAEMVIAEEVAMDTVDLVADIVGE